MKCKNCGAYMKWGSHKDDGLCSMCRKKIKLIKYKQGVKKMVIADFSGNFTNPDNCKEGTKGVVLTEGKYEEKESFKGDKYNQLSIDVEVGGKKLIHSPRMSEGKKLVSDWGGDTKKWVGKTFICHVVNYKAMGQTKQCIEIEPIVEKLAA